LGWADRLHLSRFLGSAHETTFFCTHQGLQSQENDLEKLRDLVARERKLLAFIGITNRGPHRL